MATAVDEKTDEQVEEPTRLAEAAQAALSGDEDDPFEGMENTTKVKFVGMAMDSLEDDMRIGTEYAFIVRARCVGVGDEAMTDGHVRHTAKMKVESVVMDE